MKVIKKSFNLTGDMAQRIDEVIQTNPGISFTWLVNQALLKWLQKPEFNINMPRKKMTKEEIKKFMAENKDLMDDLAK